MDNYHHDVQSNDQTPVNWAPGTQPARTLTLYIEWPADGLLSKLQREVEKSVFADVDDETPGTHRFPDWQVVVPSGHRLVAIDYTDSERERRLRRFGQQASLQTAHIQNFETLILSDGSQIKLNHCCFSRM